MIKFDKSESSIQQFREHGMNILFSFNRLLILFDLGQNITLVKILNDSKNEVRCHKQPDPTQGLSWQFSLEGWSLLQSRWNNCGTQAKQN